jgi:hypothetical protein
MFFEEGQRVVVFMGWPPEVGVKGYGTIVGVDHSDNVDVMLEGGNAGPISVTTPMIMDATDWAVRVAKRAFRK